MEHLENHSELETLAQATSGESSSSMIITGMHRSGTSVVAEALGWGGLFLGDHLKGPSRFNPEGYFEDQEMIQFHEELLQLNGTAWDANESLQNLSVPEKCYSRARELVAGKFHGQPVWGWKDPRTTLFLEFWDRILPEAKWIFVIRRPAEVVSSMLERGDMRRFSTIPIKRALRTMRLWLVYNQRIYDFARRNRDRSILILTPDDFQEPSQQFLSGIISEQWRINVRPIDFGKVYIPNRMQQKKVRAWIGHLTNSFRPALRLFEQLDQLREAQRASHAERLSLPDTAPRFNTGQTSGKRVVCIISPREFSYSETFLRDHIRWLPAEVKALYGGSRHSEKMNWDTAAGLKLLDLMINGSEFPNRSADGRRLISVAGRGVDLVLRHIFKITKQPMSDLALRRYWHRGQVDAVLAEFGQTGAQVMRACGLAQIPLIVHFHGSDAYSRRWIDKYLSSYREMFTIASAIVAVSRHMVEQLASLGAPRDKLFCNPCGVDTELFDGADPLSAPPTFVAVGRFVEKKGPCLTLLAFERVFRKYSQARLVMFGDGDLLGVCRQLTRALGIEQAVSYQGVRSRLEVAVAMRQGRAFVQHSIRAAIGDAEGTPVSVLEASAAGLPVVSTRHGGIQEAVLDGETGFLVAEGDIDGMAERMIELVESPDDAAALGQRGRRHILAHYSMEKSIAALMEIIEWAIRRKS